MGLLEPGVRPSCTALAWSCSVILPGVASAARNLQQYQLYNQYCRTIGIVGNSFGPSSWHGRQHCVHQVACNCVRVAAHGREQTFDLSHE